jgi:hypothetical protein
MQSEGDGQDGAFRVEGGLLHVLLQVVFGPLPGKPVAPFSGPAGQMTLSCRCKYGARSPCLEGWLQVLVAFLRLVVLSNPKGRRRLSSNQGVPSGRRVRESTWYGCHLSAQGRYAVVSRNSTSSCVSRYLHNEWLV